MIYKGIIGLVDGDGCIYISKRDRPLDYEIYLCGNYDIVKGFKEFCEKFIISTAQIRKDKSIFKYRLSGHKALKIINLLYQNCNFYLDRKKDLSKQLTG